MPMRIEHIDAIARQKQRDVLYLVFRRPESDCRADITLFSHSGFQWQNLPIRKQVIEWLDAQGIGWRPCAQIADPNAMLPYYGQLYIDLPFDQTLPAYQALEAFIELPDGSMRFPEVSFLMAPLDYAMMNAAHDEPGFWAKAAENF